ncbi:PREDICTED: UDP-glycosyltransferase 73B4-like isoform X3 [Populus euphratica]|uniref:Glycosyltransferase n=1 Tax=Populus euphratica TaxID=75702 RepID=A0AAJ6UET0_POPEU|nr:PREDICTED: UDP-glycosyltransferase 73B4-like isoform X3 [Populus euphratica]
MTQEIWVVPFFGQGHLLPSMELCKHVASRNFRTTLVIPSNLSSNIPSYLHLYPLLEIAELPSSPPPLQQPGLDPPFPPHMHHNQMAQGLENLLSTRSQNPDSGLPACAIVDVMMGWTLEVFEKFEVPTVGFFTSGACSAALEYAAWKGRVEELKPGEIRLLPGLPKEMALADSDLKSRPHRPPGGRGGPPGLGGPAGQMGGFPRPPGDMGPPEMMGPPKLGGPPPWLDEVKGSIAYMINTCDDLERPFIQYLTDQVEKPVWGIGPLLPELYWKSAGSLLHDHEIRTNRRQSNVTEEEVIAWLDSKPLSSVLYVSFGSEVGPEMEEYPNLADALEASNRPFIWVIQSGSGGCGPPPQFFEGQPGAKAGESYFPCDLDKKVGERGLIIHGWAPQLLILSHPSTGGFLSHCGWNSTVEAIGRGIPILAWPVRGDQNYNAKLVVKHLKVGCMVSDDLSQLIKKDDIIKGVESLWGDEDVKNRAALLRAKFKHGFPTSSVSSLDAFRDFINQKAV